MLGRQAAPKRRLRSTTVMVATMTLHAAQSVSELSKA